VYSNSRCLILDAVSSPNASLQTTVEDLVANLLEELEAGEDDDRSGKSLAQIVNFFFRVSLSTDIHTHFDRLLYARLVLRLQCNCRSI
jgi:hypothetical protein